MHTHTLTHAQAHTHTVAELRTPQRQSPRRQNIPIMPPQFSSLAFSSFLRVCVEREGESQTDRPREEREIKREGEGAQERAEGGGKVAVEKVLLWFWLHLAGLCIIPLSVKAVLSVTSLPWRPYAHQNLLFFLSNSNFEWICSLHFTSQLCSPVCKVFVSRERRRLMCL